MTSIGARLLRTRWFVRAPISLFRARLGFVFGARMLLLEHTGRKSGRARYVVLETVARPSPNRVVIASGFGERSEWFRNLVADPHARVSIGFRHRVPALAEVLSPEEHARVLDEYRQRHPRAYRRLAAVIVAATGTPLEQVPLVALTLRH